MAKEFAKKFYNSKAWKSCRKSYISNRILIDGGMCEKCHEQLGYIVHHIQELTPTNINNPDISLNHCNLRYDCKECHDKEEVHAFIKRKETKCFFDSNGNPIPKE